MRAVRFLCGAGIGQFLDIGTGFPTSPNVHEVAQSADEGARVVYVDNDPMVFLHAEALMAKTPQTAVVRADLWDVELAEAGRLLDLPPAPGAKKKALVATGNSILTAAHALLSDPDAR